MTTRGGGLTVLAPAKINLGLEVLGRRPDGYHEVATILQALRLHDTIHLRRSRHPGVSLELSPRRLDLGPAEQNLAVRAARLVLEQTGGSEGIEIHLRKRIPVGAGLGGGSSDAAGVLAGLNRLLGLDLCPEGLEALGAGLGSDVPFFIRGGTQMATGRGEILRPMIPWPGPAVVLVFPNLSVSTSSIYGRGNWGLTPPGPLSSIVSRGIPGDFWIALGPLLRNDLTPAVLESAPEVEKIVGEFRRLGAAFARVTGSGSSVFGLPPDAATGSLWAKRFQRLGLWARLARPSRRGCLIRPS